ncbi:MAG: hypothetical protein ACOCZQ_02160 [Nanoarchaeota archaeon]
MAGLETQLIELENNKDKRNIIIAKGKVNDFANLMSSLYRLDNDEFPSPWHEEITNVIRINEPFNSNKYAYGTIHPWAANYIPQKNKSGVKGILEKILDSRKKISKKEKEELIENNNIYCGCRLTWHDSHFNRSISKQKNTVDKNYVLPVLENFKHYSDHPNFGSCEELANKCYVLENDDFLSITYLCDKHSQKVDINNFGTSKEPLLFKENGQWKPFYVDDPKKNNTGFFKKYTGEIFPSKINVIDDLAKIGIKAPNLHPDYETPHFYEDSTIKKYKGKLALEFGLKSHYRVFLSILDENYL